MVNFCNPGVLGTPREFRKRFEVPILHSREPDCTESEAQLGGERTDELSELVNRFILRRTNDLLSDHLPPKVGVSSFLCAPRFLRAAQDGFARREVVTCR